MSFTDYIDGREGHFLLESGHHGELWLDLEALFLRPARLLPFVNDLAERLADRVGPDAICGPLLGGGLIASAVATVLGGSAADYAAREGLTLVSCAVLPNHIWEPSSCPLCAEGRPLEDPRRAPAD